MRSRWSVSRLLMFAVGLVALSDIGQAAPMAAPVAPLDLERGPVQQVQFFWPFGGQQFRQPGRQPNFFQRRPRQQQQQQQRRQAPQQNRVARAPRGPSATVFGETAAIENATRVVVFGDSLAADLANALATALPEDKGFQVQRMTKTSSGLVRDDFYNWSTELSTAIATEPIDVAVIFLGVNDNQSIRADGESHKPQTPNWVEIYKSRVDGLIKQLRDKDIAVYWVSQAITRLGSHSKGMAFINSVTRERVELQGAQYIDIWDAFADENGNYSSDGPDVSGTRRRMRGSDGIHFTESGNEKLAHFVSQAIDKDLSVATLGADGRRVIRQSIRGGLAVPGAGSDGLELAGGAADGGIDHSLGASAAALSTVGGGKTDGEETQTPLFTVLMRGEALEPKSGRADDFSWPRE